MTFVNIPSAATSVNYFVELSPVNVLPAVSSFGRAPAVSPVNETLNCC